MFADPRGTTLRDERRDYGRLVMVVWTPRGADERRIISMRKANERKQAPFRRQSGEDDATTKEEIARQIADDPDTAPELTEEDFDRAEVWDGNKFLGHGRAFKNGRRVGRPKGSGDGDLASRQGVLERFRAGGPGWQTRVTFCEQR